MEYFFYCMSALIISAVPTYAVDKGKGFSWSLKWCFLLGASNGLIHGLFFFSKESPFEPIINCLSAGFICWFVGIPMYFWMDTLKDLKK